MKKYLHNLNQSQQTNPLLLLVRSLKNKQKLPSDTILPPVQVGPALIQKQQLLGPLLQSSSAVSFKKKIKEGQNPKAGILRLAKACFCLSFKKKDHRR